MLQRPKLRRDPPRAPRPTADPGADGKPWAQPVSDGPAPVACGVEPSSARGRDVLSGPCRSGDQHHVRRFQRQHIVLDVVVDRVSGSPVDVHGAFWCPPGRLICGALFLAYMWGGEFCPGSDRCLSTAT